MDTQPICLTCAKSERKGCCHSTDPERQFPITFADVKRIVKATGLKPSDFMVADRPPEGLTEEFSKNASATLYKSIRNGTRLRLKVLSDGYCSLLTPAGCSLSKSERPRICSLYPNYYKHVGKNVKADPGALGNERDCLAVDKCEQSYTRLYMLMGTTRDEVESFAKKAIKEANEHVLLTSVQLEKSLSKLEER